MKYVNFGTAGVKVSRLALGLGLRGQTDESEAERLIRRALDRGINLIDCANIYGPADDRDAAGRSEVILGRVLKGRLDDVVITSKVFSPVGSGPNDRGGSRYHILREVEHAFLHGRGLAHRASPGGVDIDVTGGASTRAAAVGVNPWDDVFHRPFHHRLAGRHIHDLLDACERYICDPSHPPAFR